MSRGIIFTRKDNFLQKMLTSAKLNLGTRSIVSESTYVCVLTYQISSFWHNPKEL